MYSRKAPSAAVVAHDPGGTRQPIDILVGENDRECRHQPTHTAGAGDRARDIHEAVDRARGEQIEVAVLAFRLELGVAQEYPLARLVRRVLDASCEPAEERVGDVGDDQADDSRAASAEVARAAHGYVSELGDHLPYPLRRPGAHRAVARQRLRHRGDADASLASDIGDRHRFTGHSAGSCLPARGRRARPRWRQRRTGSVRGRT